MKFLGILFLSLALVSTASARPKKKPKEVDMEKVHREGLKKAEEIKAQSSFYENKWNLTPSEKERLQKKVEALGPEEKKALKLDLETMDSKTLKEYIKGDQSEPPRAN